MKKVPVVLMMVVSGIILAGAVIWIINSSPEPYKSEEEAGTSSEQLEVAEIITNDSNQIPSANLVSSQERLSGSDFVELGQPGSISGHLVTKHGEWFLQTDSELYEVHLGNHEHRAAVGIDLSVGQKAEVTGFIYEKDIAVVNMVIDGKGYPFRSEDGRPLWAGSGRGSQRDGSGEGRGRNR